MSRRCSDQKDEDQQREGVSDARKTSDLFSGCIIGCLVIEQMFEIECCSGSATSILVVKHPRVTVEDCGFRERRELNLATDTHCALVLWRLVPNTSLRADEARV